MNRKTPRNVLLLFVMANMGTLLVAMYNGSFVSQVTQGCHMSMMPHYREMCLQLATSSALAALSIGLLINSIAFLAFYYNRFNLIAIVTAVLTLLSTFLTIGLFKHHSSTYIIYVLYFICQTILAIQILSAYSQTFIMNKGRCLTAIASKNSVFIKKLIET